jgi:hypothetical protein
LGQRATLKELEKLENRERVRGVFGGFFDAPLFLYSWAVLKVLDSWEILKVTPIYPFSKNGE